MPTYAELAREPVWGAQFVPSYLQGALVLPLRAFYNLGPASVGAPGDNNHLYGRHRSANWDLQSIYCTNRSYGTRDARDKRGDLNWYRAVDVGIQGQTLYDASHRLDALVRSGRAPGVAEWFGTFDGQTVVGWYEGRPSSSDSSHLWHLHVGLWNEFANDLPTLVQLYQTITGTAPDPSPERDDDMPAVMIQDATGIALLWPTDDGLVYQNIVTIDMAAGWNEAGVSGPIAVPSIAAMGIDARSVVQKRYEAQAAAFAEVFPDGGGSGGGGGTVNHKHTIAGTTTSGPVAA